MKAIKLLILCLLLCSTTEAQKWQGKDTTIPLVVDRENMVVIIEATATLATQSGHIAIGKVLTALSGAIILNVDSNLAYGCQLFSEYILQQIKEQEYIKAKEEEDRRIIKE